MVKHIVMWNFEEMAEGKTKEENMAIIKEKLMDLVGVVPGLIKMEIGIGYSGFDMVLYSEFTDKAALDGYAVHPEHVKVSDFVSKVRTERAACDYEV